MKSIVKGISMSVLALALAITAAPSSWTAAQAPGNSADTSEQVRRALNKLPFITVFDRIDYEVTGNTVRLTGAVTKPWDKTDAEALVKKVPGIATVVNEIEVLPLSRFDDQVRLAAYRELFNRNSSLQRYRVGSHAPIRIIVRNGHITLEGYVSSQFDKTIAGMLARHVPNAFSVTNNLKLG